MDKDKKSTNGLPESRLPKPSFLRQPAVIDRIPSDRIKAAAASAIGGKQFSNFNNTTSASFARDVTNLPRGMKRPARAASPELTRLAGNMHSRLKIRRSKSACDLTVRGIKRMDTTLAPIPQKAFKQNTESNKPTRIAAASDSKNIVSTSAIAAKRALPTPATIPRTGFTRAVTTTTAASKKPNPVAAPTSNNKVNSSKTTIGSTASKASKSIPKYDFKARFHDLLDKHNALKQNHETLRVQMGNLHGMPEELEQTKSELTTTQQELQQAQAVVECLQAKVNSNKSVIECLTKHIVETKEKYDELCKQHKRVSAEHSALSAEAKQLRLIAAEYESESAKWDEERTCFMEQLFASNMERKDLHNMVMDLRGNIRVFCRVRPALDFEQDKLMCAWNYVDEATVEIQSLDLAGGKNKQNAHTFSFDHVFHPGSNQEEIFEMVAPLIQSALDGYNVCIFAYGQTGSGKTYTMDGIPSNVGVIPRTVDLLFDSIKNYKRLGWEYEIRVTFLEIYNEVLYDLLSNEQKEMEIRMATTNKNDIYVSNITEETVETAARLQQLMHVAKTNRATAATAGNERSSRSHAVTKIELLGKHMQKNEMVVGTINLVDLAGSESPKTSTRMNETKNINRSLSELTNVILALLQKQDHIPYRNSKLTHLLMPSLGGNSKTLMFINVAPFQDCFVESVKSLRFAASVNSCKMAKAKRNRFLQSWQSSSFDKS